jgi:CPA2 family monovalent cation:H+ antiporter-2
VESLGIGFELLVVLVAAVVGAVVARWLRLPVILGYLAGGVAVGPFGLGLVHDTDTINSLANIGVVLLLFAIGWKYPQGTPAKWAKSPCSAAWTRSC